MCFPLDSLSVILEVLIVVLLLRSVVARILAALIRGPFLLAQLLFVASSLIVVALVCGLLLQCLEQMQQSCYLYRW